MASRAIVGGDAEDVIIAYERVVWGTDNAWKVEVDGEEYWFPKSQCAIDVEDKRIVAPRWLAREKGLL